MDEDHNMDRVNCQDSNTLRRTRRRLQHRLGDHDCRAPEKHSVERLWNSFNFPNVDVSRIHPSRVLRSSANTLTRTLNSMQTTFGSISQKFRRSTKRRHQLKNESPCSPVTPQTRSRCILGRTPTKLYSPFGIETPGKKTRGKENKFLSEKIKDKHRFSAKKLPESSNQNRKCTRVIVNDISFSEKKSADQDLEEVRKGIWELRQTAHRIITRSLHQ